jgi:hypothetical protein
MPYVVGIVLSLGVGLFARRVGFEDDRETESHSLRQL